MAKQSMNLRKKLTEYETIIKNISKFDFCYEYHYNKNRLRGEYYAR